MYVAFYLAFSQNWKKIVYQQKYYPRLFLLVALCFEQIQLGILSKQQTLYGFSVSEIQNI